MTTIPDLLTVGAVLKATTMTSQVSVSYILEIGHRSPYSLVESRTSVIPSTFSVTNLIALGLKSSLVG